MPVDTDLAWAAGFIDGEGCFTLSRHAQSESSFKPMIQVSQKDRRPLDKLQEMFGGSVRLQTNHRPNQADYYVWSLSAAKAVGETVRAIESWLIVKKSEAVIVMAMCDIMVAGGRRRIVNKEAREHLFEALKRERGGKIGVSR